MTVPDTNPDGQAVARGSQRLHDIRELTDHLDERFHDLDGSTLSEDTLTKLNAVKTAITAAITAVGVDKAHLDIARANEVRRMAEEFLRSYAERQQ